MNLGDAFHYNESLLYIVNNTPDKISVQDAVVQIEELKKWKEERDEEKN